MSAPRSALVLAGGRGERLAASHPGVPKPLVRVAGVPLLEAALRRLFAAGVEHVTVAVHHEADRIARALRSWISLPQERVRVLVEPAPLGTAGALALVEAPPDEPVLVTNADLVSAIDLRALAARHESAGADLTIAVHRERHRLRLGEVVIDSDARVRDYLEKPEKSWLISSGTYVAGHAAREALCRGEALGVPELVQRLLRAGRSVAAHPHDAPWIDVNDGEALREAERLVRSDPAGFGAAVPSACGAAADAAAPGTWIGLDIGATKILAIAVSESGNIVARARGASGRDDGPDAVLDRAAALAREAARGAQAIRGAGAGFAGLVDADRGVVTSSIMLPGWDGFPLADALAARLDLPVAADNDATAAGWGEYVALGEPPGLHLVVLTVGTGIGGALVIDGRLHRGAAGSAGEIGNTSVDWRGPRCWCGSSGCLNMLASGTAILEHARALRAERGAAGGPAPESVDEVGRAAAAGSAPDREALARATACLGAGIANLVNLLSPHRVALCGGVASLGEGWLDEVRAEARRRSFAEPFARVEIAFARRGYDSGAFGAAALARRRFAHGAEAG